MAAGSLFGAAGCSVVFDTDPYRGEPVDELLPSAPQVSITPTAPTTLDVLSAVIDVASVDPLAEAVTYRYEWLRDDVVTAITTATVPADQTEKGEVWTVRVFPVAGSREGLAGTASVTIGNLPPTLGYARLSRYEVWQDEVINATAGDAVDPDGDTLTTTYQWVVSGSAVAETSSSLDAADLEPGDEVTVTITVSDGTDTSASRSAGPAIIRAPEGWRQLEPNRAFNVSAPLFFEDPARGRMLYIREGVLWEYRVSGADVIPWAKLNLSGLPSLYGSSVFYDAERSRFLIWGGVDFSSDPAVPTDALYELAIPAPGQETFREITTALAPAARIAQVSINDAARERGVIITGGTPNASPFAFSQLHDDVWELDYSTAEPTFTLLDDAPPTPSSILTASVVDSQSGVAYLFGGFSAAGSGLDGIYTYDLATDALTQVASLALARGSISAVDMGDGTALIVDGSATLVSMSPSESVARFTYATRTSVPVTLTGTRPQQSVAASLVRVGDTVRWSTGLFANDLFVYELNGLDVQPRLGPNVNQPGATVLGNVIRGSGAGAGITFAFGLIRRGFDRAVGDATYTYDGSRWVPVAALIDDAFARWGASSIVDPTRQPRMLLGGSLTSNFAPNTNVITSANNVWEQVRADEVALHGAVRERPTPAWSCGNRVRAILFDQTWELDPAGAAVALNATMNGPPVVQGAGYEALSPAGGMETVVVFGGSASSDWYTTTLCTPDDEWSVQAPTGGPVGRFSPTMAKMFATSGGSTHQLLLFGGATALDSTRQHLADLWLVTMDASGFITTQPLEDTSHPSPPGRNAAMFGWDSFGGRAILFGGEGASGLEFPGDSGGSLRADTWEYRLPEGL